MSAPKKVPSKKPVPLEIDGTVYNCRRPTVDETETFSEEYLGASDSKTKRKILYAFIETLGIPEKVARGLEQEQVDFIIDELSGKKS